MDHIEKNILDTFITLMREKIRIHRVVLFDSRARGDAEPDSDMDVLVIVDDLTEEKEDYISEKIATHVLHERPTFNLLMI